MTQQEYTDQEYIKGIAIGDPKILEQIYVKYSASIFKLVQKNNGTVDDARDVIQESLIIVYKKAKQANFVLTSSLFSFFYGVCRNVWWRMLRDRKREVVDLMVENELPDDIDIEQAIIKRERHKLYLEKLNGLSAGCRQILQLYIDGKSAREIIKIMGLTSEGYVRRRKYKCKEQLLNRVKQDSRYQELL